MPSSSAPPVLLNHLLGRATVKAARSLGLRSAFSLLAKTVSKNTGMSSPENRNTTRPRPRLPWRRRGIRTFRIPPPRDTPASESSATIVTTSARWVSDRTPLADIRNVGVSRTVCRGVFITNIGANGAYINSGYCLCLNSAPGLSRPGRGGKPRRSHKSVLTTLKARAKQVVSLRGEWRAERDLDSRSHGGGLGALPDLATGFRVLTGRMLLSWCPPFLSRQEIAWFRFVTRKEGRHESSRKGEGGWISRPH